MEESIEQVERPEWLPQKFKSGQDLAKSYTELEKKIGSFVGAPDEYVVPESTQSKTLAQILSEKGKELNMSQDAFNKIVTEYDQAKVKRRDDFKKQLESLGPEQRKTVTEVITFLKNNLDEKEAEKISNGMRSIEDVMVFDKLRRLKNPLTSGDKILSREMQPVSKEQYMASLDRKRLYGGNGVPVDMAYRRKVQEDLNTLFNDQ